MTGFKVIADGTILGVKIFTPDGTDVTNICTSFTVKSEAGRVPTLSIETINPFLDIEIDENDNKERVKELAKSAKG